MNHVSLLTLDVIVELVLRCVKQRPDQSFYPSFAKLILDMFDPRKVQISTAQKIRGLPIFKTYSRIQNKSYTILTDKHALPPSEIVKLRNEAAFNHLHLKCDSDEEKLLLTKLGVKTVTEVEYFKNYLFPAIDQIEVDLVIDVLLYALSNVFRFNKVDDQFVSELSKIDFVKSIGGEVLKPCEVSIPEKIVF